MSWSVTNLLTFLRSFCVDESITKANLLNFIQLRYDRIYNYALGFYKTERTFSLVSGTKYYYLPRELNNVIKPKFFNQTSDNQPIKVCEFEDILKIDKDESETGVPRLAAFVETSRVQRQVSDTSDNGTLKVKSSDADDTTQKVTITGRATVSSQQVEITEELTLTGTTVVTSAYTWVYIYDISKSADTQGYVTITDTTEAFIYAIIYPYADRAEYQKWRFWPTSDVTDTIKLVGYRKPVVPQNDSAVIDVPPDLMAGFIHGLRADIHDINFDMVKAQKFEAKFEEALRLARENDMWGDDQDLIEGSENYARYDPRSNLAEVDEDTEVV